MGAVKDFIRSNYRHFNAATLVDAAEAYVKHLDNGGKMMITVAGAMSTAELGVSLAEMIRRDKVHAITCTGNNLEEDIYNLVAHEFFERVPNYRELTADQEVALRDRGLNRVTDTCIPEEEAIRRIEDHLIDIWKEADMKGEKLYPYEMFYKLIRGGKLKEKYQIDPKDSWLVAASEKNLPIWTPGWEDSTCGNIFAAHVIAKDISTPHVIRSGIEQMQKLAAWYTDVSKKHSIGFFQIAGGIAGDFPICVVPMLRQDMEIDVPYWGYFCQISDSTTSYGSYSGAVPTEKITWHKLDKHTPRFVIESDATIVAPLVFAYVLEK